MTHLSELCDELERVVKHLPGKHDQRTHAGKRGSAGGGGSAKATDAKHAAEQLATTLHGVEGLSTSTVETHVGSTMKYRINPTKGTDYDKYQASMAAQQAVRDAISNAGYKWTGYSGQYKKGKVTARIGKDPDSDEMFISFMGF